VWSHGRIFHNSSGNHGEYYERGTWLLCLVFLGETKEGALDPIIKILQHELLILKNSETELQHRIDGKE